MIRHIMNLETCISIIAAFFYGKFIEMRTKSNDHQSADINTVRYTDWAITTPLMLLVLGLAITYNHKSQFAFSSYLIMVVLNFCMLLAGYLGETGRLARTKSSIAGFTLFAALVSYAWFSLMSGFPPHTANTVIFILFFAIWTLYGVVANFEPIAKNVSYNILDVFAKCFMGLGFWAYFTRLFK
jgi:bacteriorhodopsin